MCGGGGGYSPPPPPPPPPPPKKAEVQNQLQIMQLLSVKQEVDNLL